MKKQATEGHHEKYNFQMTEFMVKSRMGALNPSSTESQKENFLGRWYQYWRMEGKNESIQYRSRGMNILGRGNTELSSMI